MDNRENLNTEINDLKKVEETLRQENIRLSNEISAYTEIMKNEMKNLEKIDKENKENLIKKNNDIRLGIKEGKKDVSFLWLFSGMLSLLGILIVEYSSIPYPKENNTSHFYDGFKSGVKKRRYLYWFIGMVFFSLIWSSIKGNS